MSEPESQRVLKSLTAYQRKRDFKRTSEPAGYKTVLQADYPRFVVQKHDARRLHYDLRLEIDGTFKSWAVTRGPSLDPTQKRLAVEVEDHPLDYGDFEGTIPKGEYGGGTVMIWDRGFWSTDDVDPASAILRGELKFTVAGSKLKGSFVIVRMAKDRTGKGRINWLLIKHTDKWAKPGDGEGVLSKDRSVASGRSMHTIASGRGPSAKAFLSSAAAPRKAGPHSARPSYKLDVVAPENDRIAGVRISSPDRAIWLTPKITKIELAAYIATVGPWMLSHVAGRPCSVLRAPEGVKGEQFFQRRLTAGMPKDLSRVFVGGDNDPYIRIDTVAGLVSLVQFGTVEFHPWNSLPGDPETPDRLVFDIDPAPDVPFAHVVEAAKELRQRLTDYGLVPFCKTTGGKGLHVVTPLARNRNVGWEDAKTFAHAVCQQMADARPDRYLTSMSKKRRIGRIFLDYLRNERTATAVAPLSPRARTGATVSMPLNWSQVRSNLDSSRFTLRTAPSLLSRDRAWSNYRASARPLDKAIRALLRKSR